MKPYKEFEPKWVKEKAPERSYRSIFRWGDPTFVKYPKESLYKTMKDIFKMNDADFKHYALNLGLDEVKDLPASRLDPKKIEELEGFAARIMSVWMIMTD